MAVRPIRPARRAASPAPDAAAAAEAVDRFLDALGLPPDVRASQDLEGTPRRVAQAWLEDLVDGYRRSPAEILADAIPSASRDLVAVTGIEFHSVCPHHLLPSRGVAHVAYLPGGKVVGFGQIVRLVDALAHRLVLQEDLARAIADALVAHLGARGAACLVDAEQLCMTVRGEKRGGARAHADAWVGAARAGRGGAAAVPRSRRPRRAAGPQAGEGGEGTPVSGPRTAIVTGGGRGIGAAVARALTGRGVLVTVFARTAAQVERVVAERGAALAVAGDVSREADVRRLVEAHERALGPVDLLVNNAGVLARGLAEELSPAAFREVLEVNLTGAFLCARAVIPGMKARRRGRIVNVASISGTIGTRVGERLQRVEVGAHRAHEVPRRGAPPARRAVRGGLARQHRHRDAEGDAVLARS